MKIAARHNIDARVAAKAASERVIQMIPKLSSGMSQTEVSGPDYS